MPGQPTYFKYINGVLECVIDKIRIEDGGPVLKKASGSDVLHLRKSDDSDFTDLVCNNITGSISVTFNHANISGTYNATTSNHFIGCDTSSAPVTINLPAAATAGAGFHLEIKDESGNAKNNNITIDGNLSETIDGELTLVLSADYDAASLYCDGSNWFIY